MECVPFNIAEHYISPLLSLRWSCGARYNVCKHTFADAYMYGNLAYDDDNDNVSDNALGRSSGDPFITPARIFREALIVIYRRSRKNGKPRFSLLVISHPALSFYPVDSILCGSKETAALTLSKRRRKSYVILEYIKIENGVSFKKS